MDWKSAIPLGGRTEIKQYTKVEYIWYTKLLNWLMVSTRLTKISVNYRYSFLDSQLYVVLKIKLVEAATYCIEPDRFPSFRLEKTCPNASGPNVRNFRKIGKKTEENSFTAQIPTWCCRRFQYESVPTPANVHQDGMYDNLQNSGMDRGRDWSWCNRFVRCDHSMDGWV